MPPRYLMSLSLVGILTVAPQVSAQETIEEIREVQAEPAAFEPRAAVSHVLTEDSADDVQPVPTQPVVAGQRARGGAGQGRQDQRARRAGPGAARRAPAPRPAVRDRDNDRRRAVIIAPRVVYNSYPYRYAYSGSYLPSRRGVFGTGYLYYGPRFGGYYDDYRYYGSYVDYGRAYDIGELRLQVSPRQAQVFVDGDYAGTVDDYDGTFQSLKLESGSYSIRLEAPGYETIEFDVRITPSQKVTYREDLRRE